MKLPVCQRAAKVTGSQQAPNLRAVISVSLPLFTHTQVSSRANKYELTLGGTTALTYQLLGIRKDF